MIAIKKVNSVPLGDFCTSDFEVAILKMIIRISLFIAITMSQVSKSELIVTMQKNDYSWSYLLNCCSCSPSFEDISVFMTVAILAATFLV